MYNGIFEIFKYNPLDKTKMAIHKSTIKKFSIIALLAGSLSIGVPHFGQIKQKNHQHAQVKKNQNAGVAVLLIDMQEFYAKTLSDDELKREIPNQIAILDYCEKNTVPVFVLESNSSINGHTIPILKEKIKKLNKKEYIFKESEDGFVGTSLDELLKQEGVKHVILMGAYASYCVKNTARGAIRNGYNIMTSKDIIADIPHPAFNESIPFYKQHGIYKDSYKDLLDIITTGTIEENLQKKDSYLQR